MELQIIQSKIYGIRGQKVMLDFDLAGLYQVETRVLNQAVKRNSKQFPTDLMFQLNTEEWEILKSQIVISSWGGTRKLPFAFTEQGLAMLSAVIAIEVNISIMRAFVAVRQLASALPVNDITRLQDEIKELKEYVEAAFADYNDINEDTRMQLELINQAIAELQAKDKQAGGKTRNPIGFISY